MTIPTESKLLELKDVKIYPLLTDPSGGSATYDVAVDIPGITKLSIKPNLVTKELQGDNVILDEWSKLMSVEMAFENKKVSLNALKVLQGGTVTTTGVTPATVTSYDVGINDRPGYFKIEGQILYVEDGLGDAHIVAYKCKSTDGAAWEVSDMSGDFASVKGTVKGIPSAATGKIYSVVFNETKVDLT